MNRAGVPVMFYQKLYFFGWGQGINLELCVSFFSKKGQTYFGMTLNQCQMCVITLCLSVKILFWPLTKFRNRVKTFVTVFCLWLDVDLVALIFVSQLETGLIAKIFCAAGLQMCLRRFPFF